MNQPDIEQRYVPKISEAICHLMKQYAIDLGTDPACIILQDYSSDTVGEAYFVKKRILEPKDWLRNIVVTGDFHAPRAQAIFAHILGPKYPTLFVAVESKTNLEIIQHEQAAMHMFQEQFSGCPTGDSEAIEKALYSRHGIYTKIPEGFRLRFYPPAEHLPFD